MISDRRNLTRDSVPRVLLVRLGFHGVDLVEIPAIEYRGDPVVHDVAIALERLAGRGRVLRDEVRRRQVATTSHKVSSGEPAIFCENSSRNSATTPPTPQASQRFFSGGHQE